jgi:membrane-associated protein
MDFVLHLDVHLAELTNTYGVWVYGLLFLIIFCETGLVATPILPGDSLLFAAGAIAATGSLNPHKIVLLLLCAPLLGDNCNYWIGHFLGPKVFKKEKSLFFNPEYLLRTHRFFEKHGGKTIIIARFLPIIRTFTPFVAGIGRMRYLKFLLFSIAGAILWVPTLVYCGYFFGNIPVIKKNFTLVIFAIIIISVIPALVGGIRTYLDKGKKI